MLCSPAAAQSGASTLSSWQPDLSGPAEFLAKIGPGGVISAAQFGAIPGDGVPDSQAIQNALAAAARQGASAVFLPAGEYLFDRPVSLVPNVALVGQGCSATRIVRAPRSRDQVLVEVKGVSNVRVQGIQFDHVSGNPFTTSISLRGAGSTDVVILDDCFTDSRPVIAGGDRWAVSLGSDGDTPSQRVWIGRNDVSGGLQLTANGGPGVSVLRIVDNVVNGGRNAGLAVTTLVRRGAFNDVLIARNQIINSQNLGIYIGPDNAIANGSTFANIVVAGNTIRGFTGRFPIGIYVRAAGMSTDGITISGNTLDGVGRKETIGIQFTDRFWGHNKRITNVRIDSNDVRGFERGVWLSSVDNGIVTGNSIRTTGGSRAYLIDPAQNRNVRAPR
jgi:polygalacturonase